MSNDEKKLIAGLKAQLAVLEDEVSKGYVELADLTIWETITTLVFLKKKIHGE